MKVLTENKLIELGFKKIYVTSEESGDENDFYYFNYDLYNSESLISEAYDESDGYFYSVEFLNMPDAGKFWNSDLVLDIINSLNKGVH